jgi:uncharacterized protein (TIGR02246 family)
MHAEEWQADERAVRELHTTWITAVNAGDLDRLLGLMTDDVVFVNPGSAPSGRDQFPLGFSSAHQQSLIVCTSELQDVVVAGDVAYTVTHDALTVTPRAGGATINMAGDRLTIYRKRDGRWLLARAAHTLAVVDQAAGRSISP